MSDYKDARRWIGKTIMQSETDPELVAQLEEINDLFEKAAKQTQERNHEKAVENMDEVIERVEHLLDVATWPKVNYDYTKRMENESLPALKNLRETYQERVDMQNR
mgnify:CR=1 FL=1